MITKCIVGFGLTAGIVGLMAFSPVQEAPSPAPAPTPAVIASSAPAPMAVAVAPKTDEVPAVSGIISSSQAKPKRDSNGKRQKIQKIKQELAELKAVYEKSESSYEKNEIKGRLQELKETLVAIREAAPPGSSISRSKRDRVASEFRSRLAGAKRKIAELHEQGRYEEAAALRAEIEQAVALAQQEIATRKSGGTIRARANRSGGTIRARAAGTLGKRLAGAKRKLAQLHEQGRDEEAAALQAEIEQAVLQAKRAIRDRQTRNQAGAPQADRQAPPEPRRPARADRAASPKRVGEPPQPGAWMRRGVGQGWSEAPDADQHLKEVMDRIKHMMRAAENLEAAGMMQQADELRNHADQMERKVHFEMQQRQQKQEQQHQRQAMPGRGRGGVDHNLAREVDELRREVMELREIVHQLNQKVAELSGDWN